MMFSIARLISHVRMPLYRNGYALILSSTTTSGFGVVYWVLAARAYAPDAVGLNSAMISAMTFLAGIAQLNLMSALLRFVPTAGTATRRFVIYAYLISSTVATAASLLFIAGLDVWAPTLGFFHANPFLVFWFVMATLVCCNAILQDGVLTGMRQTPWVPIKNTVFAIAKIALLIAFALILPQYGVFASWTVPLVALLLPTNLLIFQYLIPKHAQATRDHATPFVPAQIARYVAGNYLGSLCWLAATTLMPVIVLEQVGATATAYFYLSWMIVFSLYDVSANMGASLIVEAARDQTKLGIYSQRVLLQTARLLVPVVALLGIAAPYVLLIFGSNYAAEGTMLLRFLLLSAIPNIVTAVFVATARVQRRVGAVVAVLAALGTLVLASSYFLLKVFGITGVGIAWLVSQTIIAATLWFTQFRPLWATLPKGTASRKGACPEPCPERSRRAAEGLDVNSGFRARLDWARMTAMRILYWRAGRFKWVVRIVHPLLNYWSNRQHFARLAGLIPDILPTIPPVADTPPPETWVVHRLIRTVNDVTVVTLGAPHQSPIAILKLPQTDQALRSLQQERNVLETLRADSRLRDWCALLPKWLAEGQVSGHAYVVEQMVSGLEARRVLSNPAARARMQAAAVAAIAELHRRTALSVRVDAAMLARWVDEPLALVQRLDGIRAHASRNQKAIMRLTDELHGALSGRTLSVCWIHGDLVPQNIFVTPDAAAITGIVDWDQARPNDLPFLDALQLLLSTRMIVEHCELGDLVCALRSGSGWTPHEQMLLETAQRALPGDALSTRAMVLLCWLRHIAANLTKSTRYAGHWLWIAKNIETVLQCV